MEWFVPPVYDWLWSACVLGLLAAMAVALVQINRHERLSARAKLVWTLAVLFLPLAGALAWFVFRPCRASGAEA